MCIPPSLTVRFLPVLILLTCPQPLIERGEGYVNCVRAFINIKSTLLADSSFCIPVSVISGAYQL